MQKKKRKWNRILSGILSLAMVFSLVSGTNGLTVLAADETENTEQTELEKQESSEPAPMEETETAKTYSEAYLNVVALFEALPSADSITEETTDEEKQEISDKAAAALDALDALSNEDHALFMQEHPEALQAVYALQETLLCDTPNTMANTITQLPTAPGDYMLGANITLNATRWAPPAGTTTIDLNGHSITQTGANRVIFMNAGQTLTIKDSSINGAGTITGGNPGNYSGGAIYVGTSSTLNIEGGTITGNTSTNSGGAIYVNGSTLNVKGGTIKNNNGTYGGAIYVAGGSTLDIEGGTITENTATKQGGAINISNGTVNLSGGIISKNKAYSYGGGILIHSSKATLNMTGGEITGNQGVNKDSLGGGIATLYTDGLSDGPTVNLSGGVVKGNTADFGDDVYDGGGDMKLSGTFSANSLAIDPDAANGAGVVYIDKELDVTSKIKISKINQTYDGYTTGTFSSGYRASGNVSEDPNACFYLDPNGYNTKEYAIFFADSSHQELKIVKHAHTFNYTLSNNNATLTAECTSVAEGCTAKKTFSLTAKDSDYDGNTYDQASANGLEDFIDVTNATVDLKYFSVDAEGNETELNGAPKDAGNYKYKAIVTDYKDATVITTAEVSFSISKSAGSYTVPSAISDLTYTGSNQTLITAGTATNGTMYYRLGESGTWTTTAPQSTNAIEDKVFYYVKGDANYNDIGSETNPIGSVDVEIKKATITATAPDVTENYDASAKYSISVSVTVPTSGYTITYKGPEDTDYTDTNSKFTAVGVYKVDYKVTAENYDDFTSSATITINGTDIHPSVTMEGWTYGDSENQPSLTDGSNPGNGDVTWFYKVKDTADTTYTKDVPTDAGNYTVKAEIAANGNYNPGSATANFTIAQKEAALTWTSGNLTFTGSAQAPTASVSNLQEGDTCTVTVSDGMTDAGTGYSVTATELGNKNYKLPTDATKEYKIDPKPVTAVVTAKDKTYDTNVNAVVSATVDTGITGETLNIAGLTGTFDNANAGEDKTVTVDASKVSYTGSAKSSNYNVTIPTTATASITKATMTAPATDYSDVYDGASHGITVTPSETDVTITYGTEEGKCNQTSLTYKDVCDNTIYYEVSKTNYETVKGSAKVTITARPITIAGITADNKTYDSNDTATLNFSEVTYDGIVLGETLTVSATGKFSDANVGEGKTVDITDLTLGGSTVGNYVLATDGQQTETQANITVRPITVTITPNGGVYAGTITAASAVLSGVLDADKDNVSVTMTYTGKANDETTVYDGTDVPNQAGTYTVTATIGNTNYNLTGTTSADFIVNKAEAGLAVSPVADKTYGDADFNLGATKNSDGTVSYTSSDENVLTVDDAGKVHIVGAGKADVTVAVNETANYKKDSQKITVTVKKKNGTLTVTKITYGVTYGDASFTIGQITSEGESAIEYTSSDKKVATVDEDGNVTIIGAGKATITLAMAESDNYNKIDTTVVVNVAKKAVTVTADNKIKTYGDKDEKLTWTTTALVGSDTLADITATRKDGEDVGTYAIELAKKDTSNPNYAITLTDGTYTIEQKDITGATVTLGSALIATGKAQSQGIESVIVKNSDGKEMTVTYDVTGNQGTDAGSYTMTITGNKNYKGTITQTFVIAPSTESEVKENVDGDVVIGSGTIGFMVETDGKAPVSELKTDKAAMIQMLIENDDLTSDELAMVADGATIDIILKVTDASETISTDSKKQIENATSDYKIGQYIDISLFKQITYNREEGELIPLTTTGDKIQISVKVPSNLLNTDSSITRTFYIVRNHDGKVEFLPTTYDANTKALSFETDKFSDYAIVYKDTKNATNDKDKTNTATGTSPKTGDSTHYIWWLVMLLISGAAVVVLGMKARQPRRRRRRRR